MNIVFSTTISLLITSFKTRRRANYSHPFIKFDGNVTPVMTGNQRPRCVHVMSAPFAPQIRNLSLSMIATTKQRRGNNGTR